MRRQRRQPAGLLVAAGAIFLVVLGGGLAATRGIPAFALPATAPPDPGDPGAFRCTVTRVHDGDGPIHCREGQKIRLSGIAARELDESCNPGHPCPEASGAAARDALHRLASGQVLTCRATGTSYGRVTAWCWRDDGVELNCAMVASGTALRWDRHWRSHRCQMSRIGPNSNDAVRCAGNKAARESGVIRSRRHHRPGRGGGHIPARRP